MHAYGPTQCAMNLDAYPRVGKHAVTYTINFFLHKEKPNDRRATYVRAVCDIRTQKIETHRTRLTTGGNLIDYPGEVSTQTSYLC